MKLRSFALGLALAGVFPAALGFPARADSLSYDDPGMHFTAPDGWTRLEVPPGDPGGSDKQVVAGFVLHAGHSDQRSIVITVQPFSGSLDEYEKQHESELRQDSDSAFVEDHTKTTLANGMPAYFFKARTGDVASGHDVERNEYLVIDTKRAIDVAFVGGVGQTSDKDVKAALSSLYVVVYPAKPSN